MIKKRMGQTTSLMLLPAQSGKTRKATELMNKWNQILEKDGSTGSRHINLIFTSNSKLLSRQTAHRIHTDVAGSTSSVSSESESDIDIESDLDSDTDSQEDDDFNEIEYDIHPLKNPRTLLWISGGRRPKDEKDLYFDIRKNGLENIICCTNQARIQRAMALMNYLSDDRDCADLRGRTVNIWIDEADACMKLWVRHIHQIGRWGDFIHKVVLVSATMGPVVKYFDKKSIPCNLRVFRSTHADVYVKFSECEVVHEYSRERGQKPREHLCEVLDHAEIPANSRWFCPGAISKKSHEQIMEELLSRGFNVLILNGSKKQLVFADPSIDPPINVMETMTEDDLELSGAIRKLYYGHRLYERPFAVTGNLCVGRGITFASKEGPEEFLFTHGIIPNIGTAEEIYQMVARCFGNFRHFDTFVPAKLYMNQIVASKIRNQEHIAIEMARRYFQDNHEETVMISLREYLEISHEQPVERNRRTKVSRPQERVPLIIPFGPEQTYLYSLTEGTKIRGKNVFKSLRSMIAGNPAYAKLLDLINHPETKLYATAPDADIAYQREITDVVVTASHGNTSVMGIKKKDRLKDNCAVMVDKIQKRLCIVIWSVSGIY